MTRRGDLHAGRKGAIVGLAEMGQLGAFVFPRAQVNLILIEGTSLLRSGANAPGTRLSNARHSAKEACALSIYRVRVAVASWLFRLADACQRKADEIERGVRR